MKKKYIITIDSSTTAVKLIAWHKSGKIAAIVNKKIKLCNPVFGYYEQHVSEWRSSAILGLKDLCNSLGNATIECISISCQRESFVAVDANYRPLFPSLSWLDERGREVFDIVGKQVDPNLIHKLTGKPIDITPSLYKIVWLRQRKPALFKKICKVLDVHSYLCFLLTGNAVACWTTADPLGLFDIKRKDWSPLLLKLAGLRVEQLPLLAKPGTIVGRVTKNASALTGILQGTVVVAAGGDGQCAALGSGVANNDHAYINLGTAAVAGVYSKRCFISNSYRTMTACDAKGYILELVIRSGTFMIDKFMELFYARSASLLKKINLLTKSASILGPGSKGLVFVPYCNGVMSPYWNSYAGGILFGLKGSHRQHHIFRAILEGIAFEIRIWIDQIEKDKHRKVGKIVVVGGGANNKLWIQIIADVLGKSIYQLNTNEVSSKGALFLGAVACGWYSNLEITTKKMNQYTLASSPIQVDTEKYKGIFRVYKQLYPRNGDLFYELHRVGSGKKKDKSAR